MSQVLPFWVLLILTMKLNVYNSSQVKIVSMEK